MPSWAIFTCIKLWPLGRFIYCCITVVIMYSCLCVPSVCFSNILVYIYKYPLDGSTYLVSYWKIRPSLDCPYYNSPSCKLYLLVANIQGEHKNTPWFQVVIKSKLTGIFLQNWWLQLHKLIQLHVVLHTLNVPPSCYSASSARWLPGAAQKGFSDPINKLAPRQTVGLNVPFSDHRCILFQWNFCATSKWTF